jgi:hypothetical protein
VETCYVGSIAAVKKRTTEKETSPRLGLASVEWQIGMLGAGSRIRRMFQELLAESFWQDEGTGLRCVPTRAQQ